MVLQPQWLLIEGLVQMSTHLDASWPRGLEGRAVGQPRLDLDQLPPILLAPMKAVVPARRRMKREVWQRLNLLAMLAVCWPG